MSAWYYVDENRQTIGPLPRDRLIALLREMPRPGDVFVWQAGFDTWKKVSQVEELLPPPPVLPLLPWELQLRPVLPLSAVSVGSTKSIGWVATKEGQLADKLGRKRSQFAN
ncbi:DUF4339 domain-containing protein [Bradyrhizobium sp.]|uniref:DUF4339 domain-containing protein n=1 Tax=Bradyrhizobium sp. TaxID=376 RepID=UPI0039E351DD